MLQPTGSLVLSAEGRCRPRAHSLNWTIGRAGSSASTIIGDVIQHRVSPCSPRTPGAVDIVACKQILWSTYGPEKLWSISGLGIRNHRDVQ